MCPVRTVSRTVCARTAGLLLGKPGTTGGAAKMDKDPRVARNHEIMQQWKAEGTNDPKVRNIRPKFVLRTQGWNGDCVRHPSRRGRGGGDSSFLRSKLRLQCHLWLRWWMSSSPAGNHQW